MRDLTMEECEMVGGGEGLPKWLEDLWESLFPSDAKRLNDICKVNPDSSVTLDLGAWSLSGDFSKFGEVKYSNDGRKITIQCPSPPPPPPPPSPPCPAIPGVPDWCPVD